MRLNLNPNLRTGGGEPLVHKQRIYKVRRLLGIAVWLLLATGLWFMQSLSYGTESIVDIPIVYEQMPEEIGVEGQQPQTLSVTVSARGSQLLYRWMKGVSPIVLSMPQTIPPKGHILFSNSYLTQKARESLGGAIQIRELYPDQISLRAFPLQRKVVPIVSHLSISARDGYMVLPYDMTPMTVELYGSREALAPIQEVHTKTLVFKSLSHDNSLRIPIEAIPNVYISPDTVLLPISVVELTERRVELPVEPLDTPSGFVAKLLPARVSLTLTMPITDYNKPLEDQLSVVVDMHLVAEALSRGGEQPEMLPVRVEGLPEWVVRASVSPRAVQYILERVESRE